MNRGTDVELRRLQEAKGGGVPEGLALGPEMIGFFKQSVEKRQKNLTKIAECWSVLVPEMLNEHCALDSLSRGVLTVLVDSSSHLYELKQLLLAGLQQQLMLACKKSGLRKISLRPGRWYELDERDRKIRF
jgi:Dna[CI] antecedent, DciA